MLTEGGADLIVLDWMMPELPGIELCRKLRATKSGREIPIIMLTARGEERDRIKGLDIGADDYVVKPYSPKELISRIRAILRRAHPAAAGETLEFDDISVDTETHKVTRAGHLVHLGSHRIQLLCTFLERPGRVSRAQLLDLVWGRDIYVEERTVDVHIRRLRKLSTDGVPNLIRTIQGAGYSIDRITNAETPGGNGSPPLPIIHVFARLSRGKPLGFHMFCYSTDPLTADVKWAIIFGPRDYLSGPVDSGARPVDYRV